MEVAKATKANDISRRRLERRLDRWGSEAWPMLNPENGDDMSLYVRLVYEGIRLQDHYRVSCPERSVLHTAAIRRLLASRLALCHTEQHVGGLPRAKIGHAPTAELPWLPRSHYRPRR